MFETIITTLGTIVIGLLYLVMFLLPAALVAAAPVALALIIDAVVAPRARLAHACAGGLEGDLPVAMLGRRHVERRPVARFLVVPGALLMCGMLMVHVHPAISILPAAVLLLIARAAHAPEVGALAAAAAGTRLAGIALILLVALLALVAGPFALLPLVVALAVYAAGRDRTEDGVALAAVLLALVLVPVGVGFTGKDAYFAQLATAPVALFVAAVLAVGGIAWRIERAVRR